VRIVRETVADARGEVPAPLAFGSIVMEQLVEQKPVAFVDRRQMPAAPWSSAMERRQFGNTYNSDREEVNELAMAVDQYKLRHRRRFITFEELYDVIASLGYHK
jgi:hypothetical protein